MKHKSPTRAEPITRLEQRLAYENRFAAVYDDDVRFADGRTGSYLRVVQSGGLPGVVMLPVANGHAGLVEVFRYPTGTWEWGLPRGLAHGGDPEATARTELLEELGAEPSSLVSLGTMTPDSGILAAVVHLFWATYDVLAHDARDSGEIAGIRWLPVQSLQHEVAAGRIRDGFTLATVGAAMCRGLLQPAVAFTCAACGWAAAGGPDPDVTIGAVNWHVYTEHPGIWREVNGDHMPQPPAGIRPGRPSRP